MDDNKQVQPDNTNTAQTPQPQQPTQVNYQENNSNNGAIASVRRITAIILIASAVFFALVGVLAIWGVFDDDDLVWRSLGTLAVIAFASLVINVGMRIYEDKAK